MMLVMCMYLILILTTTKFLDKKINILLALEILMMLTIFTNIKINNFNSFNIYLMMLLSIFMVIDSVYGISILIFNSRNTSKNSFMMKI